ncbi:zinc ABC transporter substrate-binding protein [Paenibacillus sp. FSL M8-0334]|uniref:metal ABC transporter solute-binding protein, Zn/Mn family n=1 Tax=Paenibacillus sp. FSL M8-0334 TaxID=2921623 RepID=UPI0030F66269
MKRQKKATWMSAILLTIILAITGCGNSSGGIVEGKVNVITTFYPIYEFAKEIGGEDANVISLLPTGVEPHDWTPKSQDILNTSKAQLFLYNGAGLEGWVPGFLKGLNKDSEVKAVEVSQGIQLINAEGDDGHNHGGAVEDPGHEEDNHAHDDHAHDDHQHETGDHAHEDEHDHEHEGHDHAHEEEHAGDDHSHEAEADHAAEEDTGADTSGDGHNHSHHTDPHTWVSPKSALIMAENIKNSLIEVDPANKEGYEQRFEALQQKLIKLDQDFETELSGLPKKDIVVSHQAFGYLARDYGLTQHAIMGLSPDAEPRAQDIVKLANIVRDNQIRYVFFEELVSDKIAKMLASEAGVDTLVLNPVEGLTKEQAERGENYFTLMEKNLQNLKKALQ